MDARVTDASEALPLITRPFAPARPPAWGRLLGAFLSLGYRFRGMRRYDDYRLECVEGIRLLILPTVFNPRILRTGAFLAAQVAPHLSNGGLEVLDLGTGSGLGALVAARHARRVVAVDLSAAAVRCARVNALINDFEDAVEVRQGDLFEPVRGERFDRVLFNPPFYRGRPCDERDLAWRATDLAERFADGLASHLKGNGYALVLLSSFGDASGFIGALLRRRFALSIVAARQFLNERINLLKVEVAGGEPSTGRPEGKE